MRRGRPAVRGRAHVVSRLITRGGQGYSSSHASAYVHVRRSFFMSEGRHAPSKDQRRAKSTTGGTQSEPAGRHSAETWGVPLPVMMRQFTEAVDVRDRKYHLRKYRQCFVGLIPTPMVSPGLPFISAQRSGSTHSPAPSLSCTPIRAPSSGLGGVIARRPTFACMHRGTARAPLDVTGPPRPYPRLGQVFGRRPQRPMPPLTLTVPKSQALATPLLYPQAMRPSTSSSGCST